MTTDDELYALAVEVGEALRAARAALVTAESCTGGWIGKVVTDVPGSSGWFERGFVTYSNAAKQELLGVAPELIERHGAVSAQVATAMASGALAASHGSVAVAVTGIAGPEGGGPAKPVGLVWFAWARGGAVHSERRLFSGSREGVRRDAVAHALRGVLRMLTHPQVSADG